MIGGFNHNIQHQGRIFHVQTEDLGLPRARICTHVFFNGAIVAESNQTYEDVMRLVMTPAQRTAQIRDRMQNLHKSCLKLLIQGAYDRVIQQRLQTAQTQKPAAPMATTNPEPSPVSDPELAAILSKIETSRPHQINPAIQTQAQTVLRQGADQAVAMAALVPKKEEKAATKGGGPSREENIPGRAKPLFPKKERTEGKMSPEERLSNARVSRSNSSMVKNRKKGPSTAQKNEEADARAHNAARSRGLHRKQKSLADEINPKQEPT